jgi:hypothetical protein
VAFLVALGGFGAPFCLLVFRAVKRNARWLAAAAALVLCGQLIAHFWMVAPVFNPGGVSVHWLDLAALFGIGGLWVAAFSRSLSRRPIVPAYDERLTDLAEGVSA